MNNCMTTCHIIDIKGGVTMPSQTFLNLDSRKQNKLLEVAMNEFKTVRYTEVSVNRIIQNANISRGSFYTYFTDKDDLFGYILELNKKKVFALTKEVFLSCRGDIKNSFFFMRGRRRSGFVHCVSRFWWIAHILYDAERENPYELCEYFASRAFPSRAVLFSSVNLVSNPEIAKGIVQCHYDRWKEGKDDGRYPYVEANKFWNCLGGISIVDSFSRQEVYEMTMKFLNDKFPA